MELSIIDNPRVLIYSDDLLLQDIYILLSTPKGSIPFEYDFGVDLEKYVHELNADKNEIRSHILGQIALYCKVSTDNVIDIDVYFFKDDIRDICLIDILVNNQKVFGLVV